MLAHKPEPISKLDQVFGTRMGERKPSAGPQHPRHFGEVLGSAVLFDRQPFDRTVRCRTVAKVLSMGFVVRKCFQCSAGKS